MTRADLAAVDMSDVTLSVLALALGVEVEAWPDDDTESTCKARRATFDRVCARWYVDRAEVEGLQRGPLSRGDALAIAWRALAGAEPFPGPWGETLAAVEVILREASPGKALQRAALGVLGLADWPRQGTLIQRWEIVWSAAVAGALDLPLTPGNLRRVRNAGELQNILIGRWITGREKGAEPAGKP